MAWTADLALCLACVAILAVIWTILFTARRLDARGTSTDWSKP
jgi:hypothetical protein